MVYYIVLYEIIIKMKFLDKSINITLVKIYGNPDEFRWNSLDPFGCLLAKIAGAEALVR